MQKKFYSLERASQLIPLIEKSMKQLISLRAKIDFIDSIEIETDYETPFHIPTETKLNLEFHKECHKFFRVLDKLESLGIFVEDLDEGFVDIFSHLNGREIVFCYRLGDGAIKFWHNAGESFKERKLLVAIKEVPLR